MGAREAASILLDWLDKEGLLSDQVLAPGTSSMEQMVTVSPVSDQGKQLLRMREVQAVGFNESDVSISSTWALAGNPNPRIPPATLEDPF